MAEEYMHVKGTQQIQLPDLYQVEIRASRIDIQQLDPVLQQICTDDKYERVLHSYGRSFKDIWRAIHLHFMNPPDLVAFPTSEVHIQKIMQYCSCKRIALIPYGGGTSVVRICI